VASPCDRNKDVARAGGLVAGEFWVPNPWRYPSDRNLSAFEPNQVYLNRGNMQFINATYLSGAGSDGDGRGVLVGDIDGDMQPDLIVRQTGGGPLRVYANRFPKVRRLEVTLRGTKSNRTGIGARVVVEFGGRRLERQLFSNNNFFAQQAPQVRFGLGDARSVDRLTVHWPSGNTTVMRDVPTGQRLRIAEGR